MKTAGRENPNRCTKVAGNRAPGADGQNRSSSIKWAAKQEKFRPMRKCFFLTSPFIEPIRSWQVTAGEFVADEKLRVAGRSAQNFVLNPCLGPTTLASNILQLIFLHPVDEILVEPGDHLI